MTDLSPTIATTFFSQTSTTPHSGDAIRAGAKQLQPVEDKFSGERAGQFEDPRGYRWNVMTHVEDVSSEEMAKRAAAFATGQGLLPLTQEAGGKRVAG